MNININMKNESYEISDETQLSLSPPKWSSLDILYAKFLEKKYEKDVGNSPLKRFAIINDLNSYFR